MKIPPRSNPPTGAPPMLARILFSGIVPRMTAGRPPTWLGIELPPKLSQVLPEDVEANRHHRQDDDLPEEVLEEDQGAHHRQPYVGTAYEFGESPPETSLNEREHGDREDERGKQVLSLIGEDTNERNEHYRHADRSPQLSYPAGASLSLGDGAYPARYMGAGGRTLTISQAFSMIPQRLVKDFIVGQL